LYHQGTKDAEDFLAAKIPNPIDGKEGEAVTGPFYPAGSTWDTLFGKIASNYEECRAECCGIYLCMEKSILSVFGHVVDESSPEYAGSIHDIAYINWLLMCRAGFVGMEFYTPETGAWRQAHMNARYVILRVLMEAGEGLVEIKRLPAAEGEEVDNAEIILNRGLIATVGRKAIEKFLRKLNIYKSMGDVEAGTNMFAEYSKVPPEMLEFRKIVMARKEPRKLMIQPVMSWASDAAAPVIKEFPETVEGMIESFVERFGGKEDLELWELYSKEKSTHEEE